MSRALDHLAARVAADPFFLAHPLAEYARSVGLDDAALAAALGCRADDLTPLRLCRAPRPDEFRADVTAVADRFGIDSRALATAVRHGQGLAQMRRPAAADAPGGAFLAARDADPPGDEP